MKKMGLAVLAVLFISATSFAANLQPTTAKWNGNINVNKLGKYLELNNSQKEDVANISDYLNNQIKQAENFNKDQKEMYRNAIYGNLKLMKKTLTKEQYKKYIRLVNLTLQNSGVKLNK